MQYREWQRAALAALVLSTAGTALAQSNIDPAKSWAWSENAGWINLYPSAQYGVLVTDTHLSGYAWGENTGWIWFGDGPDDNTAYTNTGSDHGVNNDGSGSLSGWAWGENIGWINFDTSGTGGSQVQIDMTTGEFGGYAWAENIGWINFGDGYNTGLAFLPASGTEDWSLYD